MECYVSMSGHPGLIQSDLKQIYYEFLFSFAENDLSLLSIVLVFLLRLLFMYKHYGHFYLLFYICFVSTFVVCVSIMMSIFNPIPVTTDGCVTVGLK